MAPLTAFSALALFSSLPALVAHAAFPGQNGRIAYVTTAGDHRVKRAWCFGLALLRASSTTAACLFLLKANPPLRKSLLLRRESSIAVSADTYLVDLCHGARVLGQTRNGVSSI